jgi:hypothetical protein
MIQYSLLYYYTLKSNITHENIPNKHLSMENDIKIHTVKNRVLVFKTSVRNQADIVKLSLVLNRITKSGKWNFDLEDCDKILRVESTMSKSEDFIRALNQHAFECVELED